MRNATARLIARFTRTFHKGMTVSFDFDWDLETHPRHVFFGHSGAGKSTILRCIAGLDRISSGEISLGGRAWSHAEKKIYLPPQQRKIAYLSQDSTLFPHLSVKENIEFGANQPLSQPIVSELIDLLDLSALLSRYPSQLSGGQKQRVALARSLATKPALLLLDEPFSALDHPSRESLRLRLKSWLQALRVPFILVTHSPIEASTLGETIHLLDQGLLVETGESASVLRRPKSLRSARLVGIENILEIDSRHFGLRAEDILLSAGPNRSSFEARVLDLYEEGPLVRMKLEGKHVLTALVPRSSAIGLGSKPGSSIHVEIPKDALWEIHP